MFLGSIVSKYKVGQTTKLPTPTKEGYTFVGWSLSSLLSDTFTTLPTDTMQDIKLYAKFE